MATTLKISSSQTSLEKECNEASTNFDEQDIFNHHLTQYDRSKTVKVINFVNSLIVALLSGKVSSSFTSYGKIIGLLIGIISFILSRKFLRLETNPPSKPSSSKSSFD